MELSDTLVAILATLMLSLLSFGARWLGKFSLADIGADLSLVAVAIGLSSVCEKLVQNAPGLQIVGDFFVFMLCLVIWFFSLKLVRISQEKAAKGALKLSRTCLGASIFMGAGITIFQIGVTL